MSSKQAVSEFTSLHKEGTDHPEVSSSANGYPRLSAPVLKSSVPALLLSAGTTPRSLEEEKSTQH